MFEKILLPVDGSEPSRRAVRVAGELAKCSGGEVLVFHVWEREVNHLGGFELEAPDEAQDLVDEVVRELKDQGVSARGEVIRASYGRTTRELLEAGEEFGANIIVMGTRGLSDFAGLVLGSVTHKVLHLAHCPVLVVR
jgi:nucleotide-binding universal stress UspA family protein